MSRSHRASERFSSSADIWIPREGVTLRYSVNTPGFLARFDARVGSVDEMTYQFRDGLGLVIASGSVTPWLSVDADD